jgi:hypothetical protein
LDLSLRATDSEETDRASTRGIVWLFIGIVVLAVALPLTRADLKLLLGDQVYIDAPFRAFVLRRLKESWIERHISRVYHRSWDRLSGFLTDGANLCTSDDHEYWNDFPNRPGLPWPRLRPAQPESTMRRHAQDYRAGMQLAEPRWPFHIGDQASPRISFLSVDTRVNRTPIYALADGTSPQFMDQGDLDEVCSWITNLRTPGVLALGQPLLTPPLKLTMGRVVADVNLPAYGKQYAQLCRALTAARADIMVLAGDVHFGRVAQVQLVGDGRAGARIVEVVSSPLAQLHGAKASFPLPPRAELRQFPHTWMPEFDHLAEDADVGGVTYLMTIPRPKDGRGRPKIPEGPEADHYMTVRLEDRLDGAVDATVFAYLIRRPRTEGPPELAWHQTFLLRTAEHVDAEHNSRAR